MPPAASTLRVILFNWSYSRLVALPSASMMLVRFDLISYSRLIELPNASTRSSSFSSASVTNAVSGSVRDGQVLHCMDVGGREIQRIDCLQNLPRLSRIVWLENPLRFTKLIALPLLSKLTVLRLPRASVVAALFQMHHIHKQLWRRAYP